MGERKSREQTISLNVCVIPYCWACLEFGFSAEGCWRMGVGWGLTRLARKFAFRLCMRRKQTVSLTVLDYYQACRKSGDCCRQLWNQITVTHAGQTHPSSYHTSCLCSTLVAILTSVCECRQHCAMIPRCSYPGSENAKRIKPFPLTYLSGF